MDREVLIRARESRIPLCSLGALCLGLTGSLLLLTGTTVIHSPAHFAPAHLHTTPGECSWTGRGQEENTVPWVTDVHLWSGEGRIGEPRLGRLMRLAGNRTVELVENRGLGLWETREGARVIWAFWDSLHPPAFIRLGLATIACHNPRARLLVLTPGDIHGWLDHVHPAFEYLLPAHQADYARARLLDEYGGVYVDADSVGLASLASLFDKLHWYDLVNISWPPDGDAISITTMGPMRARSAFTAAWVTDLHLLLDLKLPALLRHYKDPKRNKFTTLLAQKGAGQMAKYPISWNEMLRMIVIPVVAQLVREKALRYFSLNGDRSFGQLVAHDAFKADLDLAKTNASFTFVDTEILMYHNSQMAPEARSLELGAAASSSLALSELLRLSFAKCRQRLDSGSPPDGGPEQAAYSIRSPALLAQDTGLIRWILERAPDLLSSSL